jgi:guanylate kinase
MRKMVKQEAERQPIDAVDFVFIGPSGSGKSTLRAEICKRSISGHNFMPYQPVTSRRERPGEDEYIFIDDAGFDKLLSSQDIIFSNTSYGNRFLTLWPRKLEPSWHYIYIYLPKAAQKLKNVFPRTKIVQIIPPDLSILEARIKMRDPAISALELRSRLSSAKTEIATGRQIADTVFVNESPLLRQNVLTLSEKISRLLEY